MAGCNHDNIVGYYGSYLRCVNLSWLLHDIYFMLLGVKSYGSICGGSLQYIYHGMIYLVYSNYFMQFIFHYFIIATCSLNEQRIALVCRETQKV